MTIQKKVVAILILLNLLTLGTLTCMYINKRNQSDYSAELKRIFNNTVLLLNEHSFRSKLETYEQIHEYKSIAMKACVEKYIADRKCTRGKVHVLRNEYFNNKTIGDCKITYWSADEFLRKHHQMGPLERPELVEVFSRTEQYEDYGKIDFSVVLTGGDKGYLNPDNRRRDFHSYIYQVKVANGKVTDLYGIRDSIE